MEGVYRRTRAAIGRVVIQAAGPVAARWYKDRIPHQGSVIDTSDPVIPTFLKGSLRLGQYERPEVTLLKSHFRMDVDVVELGSSIGVIASFIARRLAPERRLVCVEADERLIPSLQKNLSLNAKGATTHVVAGAIDYTGRGSSFVPSANTLAGELSKGGAGRPVASFTLSDILTSFAISDFSLICDIEGAEAGLILTEDLQGCRQLLIEVHDSQHGGDRFSKAELVEQLVGRHGFRLVASLEDAVLFDRAES